MADTSNDAGTSLFLSIVDNALSAGSQYKTRCAHKTSADIPDINIERVGV